MWKQEGKNRQKKKRRDLACPPFVQGQLQCGLREIYRQEYQKSLSLYLGNLVDSKGQGLARQLFERSFLRTRQKSKMASYQLENPKNRSKLVL